MSTSIIPPIDTTIQQSLLNKSRRDKFRLVLTLPNVIRANQNKVRSNSTFNIDTLQFSVQGTIVPQIEVPPIETRYMGSTIPISSHARPTYAPIKLTFAIDNRFNNYWALFFWLNALRDQHEGLYGIVDVKNSFDKIANLKDYSTDFTIYGLDEFNEEVIKFTYKSAFPTMLGDIQYDYQKNDELVSTVDFVFRELNVDLIN